MAIINSVRINEIKPNAANFSRESQEKEDSITKIASRALASTSVAAKRFLQKPTTRKVDLPMENEVFHARLKQISNEILSLIFSLVPISSKTGLELTAATPIASL